MSTVGRIDWKKRALKAEAKLDKLPSLAEIRRAVADYIGSEGCGCCHGTMHAAHYNKLGELLRVPMHRDGSGFNFAKYRSKS